MTKLVTPKKHQPKATTSLINMIGATTPTRMAIRELVINGFESLVRKFHSGQEMQPNQGVVIKSVGNKFCCVDYGEGMTKSDVKKHLQSLGFSGTTMTIGPEGEVLLDGNKGIGSKTACLPKNLSGMQYYTMIDDHCESFILHEDSDGDYAFKKFPDHDFEIYYEVSDEEKEEIFGKDHLGTGVAVVLHGMSPEENTWNTICGSCVAKNRGYVDVSHKDFGGNTIVKFSNHRFYENIFNTIDSTLKVETTTTNLAGKTGATFKGTRHYLEHYKDNMVEKNYNVLGIEAKVQWWFLKEDRTTSNPAFETNCFTTFVHMNECYGDYLESPSSRYATAKRYGIKAGFKNVVVVVHLPESEKIRTDAARSCLMIDGNQIAHQDFQAVVEEDLPEEIIEYLQKQYSQNFDSSQMHNIMKKLLREMKLNLPITQSSMGKDSENIVSLPSSNSSNTSVGKTKSSKKKNISCKQKMKTTNNTPDVKFLPLHDEDIIAEWHPTLFRIHINEDSRYFDIVKKQYFERYSYQGDTLNNKILMKIGLNVFQYVAFQYLYWNEKPDQEITSIIEEGINGAAMLKSEQIKTLTRHLGSNAA